MLTLVGLYAESTFWICDRVTGGASSPQPSSSALVVCGAALALRTLSGLNPPPAAPPTRDGVKTGFDATGGGGLDEPSEPVLSPEYLDPDASATFRTMPSGDRSLSVRAVT